MHNVVKWSNILKQFCSGTLQNCFKMCDHFTTLCMKGLNLVDICNTYCSDITRKCCRIGFRIIPLCGLPYKAIGSRYTKISKLYSIIVVFLRHE